MVKFPSLEDLLEAGVHYGHEARRWNPKMKQFIFTQNMGIHLIDLEKTESQLRKAAEFVKDLASKGGIIIFLGTKKQIAEIVKTEAQRVGAMYLTHRWIGGLITNFDSVRKTLEKMQRLEEEINNKESRFTKRELLLMQRELDKLNKILGGIKNLTKLPDALFVVDAKREDNAIKEARKSNIAVVALVDTNGDPSKVTYPIVANDDSIKSVSLLVKTIADAYLEGKSVLEKKIQKETKEAEEKS